MKKLTVILCCIITFAANAQKLPATQQSSLRVPANVKIDGKPAEWGTFQAYNHNCDIYYTIANDDDNLYIAIQCQYTDVIRRILNGSITFTVNPSGKKDDKGGMSITYPVLTAAPMVNFKFKPATDLQADSAMNVANKKVSNQWKTIKTSGIKGLDTVISVYNDDGVIAAGLFNNKFVYTCELSVTLKQLGLNTVNPTKFAYHIMVNEVTQHGIEIKKDDSGRILSINVTAGAQMGQAATDFWGEYTLAKK